MKSTTYESLSLFFEEIFLKLEYEKGKRKGKGKERKGKGEEGARNISGKKKMREEKKSDKSKKKRKILLSKNIRRGGGTAPKAAGFLHFSTLGCSLCYKKNREKK